MVENSDKTWSPGEGNGKLLWYSYLENSVVLKVHFWESPSPVSAPFFLSSDPLSFPLPGFQVHVVTGVPKELI